MTYKEAKNIAQPFLIQGVVCVLSDGSSFVVNGEADKESVKAYAESRKLEVFEVVPEKVKQATNKPSEAIEANLDEVVTLEEKSKKKKK